MTAKDYLDPKGYWDGPSRQHTSDERRYRGMFHKSYRVRILYKSSALATMFQKFGPLLKYPETPTLSQESTCPFRENEYSAAWLD